MFLRFYTILVSVMKNNKLVNILKSFSIGEIKSLEKFIISPFFKAGRDINDLFKILKSNYPEFDSDEIDRENVFEKLFPDQKYNELKLKNLASALTYLAEQFLIHNSLKSSEIYSDELLAFEYNKRDIDKLFISSINSLELKLDKKLFDSDNCFSEEDKVERLKEEFYLRRDNYHKSIPAKLRYSELFTETFLIRFLRMLKDKIILTGGYNTKFESPVISAMTEGIDIEKIISVLEKNNYSKIWLVKIYYYALRSAENSDERKYYQKYRQAFIENINFFSRREKYFIFNDFLHYCTRNYVITHKHSFRAECFEIYKEMFQNNVLSPFEDGFLSIVEFRNIVFTAISVEEYGWLKEFLYKHSEKLKPENRESMLNLAKAYISFKESDFHTALNYINRVQYDVFLYKLDIKNLLLRIYYELNLFDQAFQLTDSYRHFLDSSSEFSDTFKMQYYNFINFYNKILNAKDAGNYSIINSVISDMKKTEVVAFKVWLIEKAVALLKDKN